MSSMKTKMSKGKKSPNTERPTMEVFVSPSNGRGGREVVVRSGEKAFTDTINPFKASAREGFTKRVAEHFAIDDPDYMAELRVRVVEKAKDADATAEQHAHEAGAAIDNVDRSAKALADASAEDITAAEEFLKNPDLMDELGSDLGKLGIAGEIELGQTLYLIAVSRKLHKPLGSSVKSSSSSGKSFVVENVTSLVPPEDVLQATSITPSALYYMPPGSLKHMLVVVGERAHTNPGDQAETANATTAMREMQSRGRLDKLVTMKSDDGGMRTQHITQEGPIAYIDTTTQQEIFEEDATRMLSLATDE